MASSYGVEKEPKYRQVQQADLVQDEGMVAVQMALESIVDSNLIQLQQLLKAIVQLLNKILLYMHPKAV